MMNADHPVINGEIPDGTEMLVSIFGSECSWGMDVRIGIKFPDGSIAVAEPLVFRVHERGVVTRPCFTADKRHLAKFAEELGRRGFRTEDQDSHDTQLARINDLKERIADLTSEKDKLLAKILQP